ncbi:hypothetical protein IPM19_00730 [bacterium]|nr:MAG: hypothetical protein IPM19_00730 [bacterium]
MTSQTKLETGSRVITWMLIIGAVLLMASIPIFFICSGNAAAIGSSTAKVGLMLVIIGALGRVIEFLFPPEDR